MAPINFEDNIREKLEGREIQPSANAWKKLSTQLEGTDKKQSATYIWYAIAASFIGILILASVFLNQANSNSGDKSKLVDADSSEKMESKEIPQINPPVNASEEFAKTIIVSEDNKSNDQIRKSIQPNKIETPTQFIEKSDSRTEAVAMAEISKLKELESPNPVSLNDSKEDLITKAKVAEVVAKVELMQKSNTSISSEEIDALLATAQRELRTQRILNSVKVDPAALLGDVELELERSFRDKVFSALGDGYQFIRTAVVERNN
jgi:hypothetical protein